MGRTDRPQCAEARDRGGRHDPNRNAAPYLEGTRREDRVSIWVYESELPPGAGIPLHKHPFAEFLYVLEGTIHFGRLNAEGTLEWLTCQAGESVLAPINAPHTTQNQSGQPAKFLSVANFHHEFILTNAGRFVEKEDPVPTHPNPADLQRFDELARQYQGYRVELTSGKGKNTDAAGQLTMTSHSKETSW